MRDRFKFLRRPPSGTSPAAKRRRIDSGGTCEDVMDDDYTDGGPSYDDEEFIKDVKVARFCEFVCHYLFPSCMHAFVHAPFSL